MATHHGKCKKNKNKRARVTLCWLKPLNVHFDKKKKNNSKRCKERHKIQQCNWKSLPLELHHSRICVDHPWIICDLLQLQLKANIIFWAWGYGSTLVSHFGSFSMICNLLSDTNTFSPVWRYSHRWIDRYKESIFPQHCFLDKLVNFAADWANSSPNLQTESWEHREEMTDSPWSAVSWLFSFQGYYLFWTFYICLQL